MQLGAVFLAFGLATLIASPATLVNAQSVGADGYTTVATATCTTTGTNIYAYVDTSAVSYNYMCGGGSGGSTLSAVASASVKGWQDCYTYCDNYIASVGTTNCTGFTFVSSSTFSSMSNVAYLQQWFVRLL